MKIYFQSGVSGSYSQVFEAFDKTLFEYLLPKQATLIKFEGSEVGNVVHIQFPFNTNWISTITEVNKRDGHNYFIDRGTKLPFGLKHWEHKHIVRQEGKGSVIEDDITFSTGNKWLDFIYYPGLYLAFYPRKKQYKIYFNRMFGVTTGKGFKRGN